MDLDNQIERLRRCEAIEQHEVEQLCFKARELLASEANVQPVDSPVSGKAATPQDFRKRCLYKSTGDLTIGLCRSLCAVTFMDNSTT